MPYGPRPEPLEWLPDEILTTRDAMAGGATRDRLRSRDLDHRIHGVRAAATTADDLPGRCRMLAARLSPGIWFSHQTAARLIGVPLPRRSENDPMIDVTVLSPARAPHASGLRGHSRRAVAGDVVVLRNGLRISAGPRLWLELASRLPADDAVAAGDHLLRRAWFTPDDLARRMRVQDPLARSRVARRTAALLDPAAESPRESRLRCILLRGGFASMSVNVETTLSDGSRVRPDLAWHDIKLAIEYQGDYHRDPAQWRRDLNRRARMEADGWTVLELGALDLVDERRLCAQVAALRQRAARFARNG